ncbi:MAG TPA: glycine-rich protein [Solirubrobacterales bacterium]|nr:glycine-rich protein [Solirubrobacterales bacterium]
MRLVWSLVVLLAVCAGARLAAPDARAAETPATVASVFNEVGAHTYTVPAGVTSIHVIAVGAPGGSKKSSAGGRGAVATADVAVTPGQALGVYVGGPGTVTTGQSNPGGFNGGGDGVSYDSTGGGGASDIRTGGPSDLGSRLVVAAGGGGAGSLTVGASGGQAADPFPKHCEGGAAGTASSGGKGGAVLVFFEESHPGGTGTLGKGGSSSRGGAGGGGLYGGGAGADGIDEGDSEAESCGGGGGSSGFGPGTSATSVAISEFRTPSVTISYVTASSPGSGTGPANPGGGSNSGNGPSKATLSLPAVQHGKSVVGTVMIPANRSALKATLSWQTGSGGKGSRVLAAGKALVGSLTEAPLKKGLHSFTVKLNKRGKKSLAKLGKLKLTLEVRVTPPRGAAAVASKKLTLKP